MPGIGTSGFFVCRRADAASAFCSFSAVIGEWTLKVYVLFFCLNADGGGRTTILPEDTIRKGGLK